jgi:endonuclease/exonuclease/phosphatase family metal-dependent hydrolase
MRVATWNLERPSRRSWKRLPRQRARMAEIDADIWILTETRASIAPADSYHGIHTPPHPVRRPDPDERWVSIWSRWPLKPTSITPNPRGSVAVIVEAPTGPVIVYGSVLAWANEKGEDGQARMWQVHYDEIRRQGREWRSLGEEHPGFPLIVAGDLNQDRDGSGWYGTRQGRELLTEAFAAADLTCLTDEDVVASGKLAESHLIDHIAASRSWVTAADPTLSCWEKTDRDGVRLSDHPTVVVDLKL